MNEDEENDKVRVQRIGERNVQRKYNLTRNL